MDTSFIDAMYEDIYEQIKEIFQNYETKFDPITISINFIDDDLENNINIEPIIDELINRVMLIKPIFKKYGLDFKLVYNTKYGEDWSCPQFTESFPTEINPILEDILADIWFENFYDNIYKIMGIYKVSKTIPKFIDENTKQLKDVLEINDDS